VQEFVCEPINIMSGISAGFNWDAYSGTGIQLRFGPGQVVEVKPQGGQWAVTHWVLPSGERMCRQGFFEIQR
jgi:hypothetical protein